MDKSKLDIYREKAAQLFKFFTETKEEKFETVKVKDADTLVDYEDLSVGSTVSISTSTGSETAPDGEYALVNGAEIEVEDGKISEVIKPEDSPIEESELTKEKLAEATVEPEAEDSQSVSLQDFQELQSQVAQLVQVVDALTQAIDGMPSNEDVQNFNSKVEILSKIPTQLSADNRAEIKESELDKYKRMANSIKK